MSHLNAGPGSGLEDKLRGMILSNNRDDGAPGPTLPTSEAASPPGAESAQPKPGRKRLNQAQRRELSAQLSITIDPRAQAPPPNHNYRSSPGFAAHRGNAAYQNGNRPYLAASEGHQVNSQDRNGHPQNYPHQQRWAPNGRSPNGPPQSQYQQPHNGRGFIRQNDRSGPTARYQFSDQGASRGPRNYDSRGPLRQFQPRPEVVERQAELLNFLSDSIIRDAEISFDDIARNEAFRAMLERICRDTIVRYEGELNGKPNFPHTSVQLRCFGSLASGYATKASDLDLGLLSPYSFPQPDDGNSPIPRLVEKAFLDAGLGARLLTRTRIPIIKLCEKPSETLRQALLEERTKWEQGEETREEILDEAEGRVETPVVEASVPHVGADQQLEMESQSQQAEAEKLELATIGSEAYIHALARLRQQSDQDVAAYSTSAKKLLRKVGGRDILQSNFAYFTADDFRRVTDVAHAFVHGLSNVELKQRLLSKTSLTRDVSIFPNTRSLQSAVVQTEGEALAMAWEQRELREHTESTEQEAQRKLDSWAELQDDPRFGLDPVAFAKELKTMRDSLEKIPSVAIQTLQQGRMESASEYYSRAMKLMIEVGVFDNPHPDNTAHCYILHQYALGIRNDDIRSNVVEAVEAQKGTHSLKAIGRLHKALQLCQDLEKLLAKDSFPGDRGAAENYVAILHRPLQKLVPANKYFDMVIPVSPADAGVLEQLKALPDPGEHARRLARDPFSGALEFPKSGVGVQCDINFSAQLGIHNTHLLRCYSLVDPRVRPLVLFVKHWAKVRGINTTYRGTLSSYGYVLMVIHYLVNVVEPFVCPNLQMLARPPNPHLSPAEVEATEMCRGRDVRFWRDEDEIKSLAAANQLNQNSESVGHLLRGFFEYYAHPSQMSSAPRRGFDWGREVISIRTPGGLQSKEAKGWIEAKTTIERRPQAPGPTTAGSPPGQNLQAGMKSPPLRGGANTEVKEVRHRFLFAIEDPFELDHNVARTVNHKGIVKIRDEFRRAWRVIKNAGDGYTSEELLQEAVPEGEEKEAATLKQLMEEIHGPLMQ